MNTKVLSWIAIISIAANLLLAGFIVGKEVRPFPSFDPTRGHGHWVRNLPTARQDELMPILRQGFRQGKPLHLRKLHREFRAALTADPLDAQALAASLEQLRSGHEQRQIASHQAFVQLATALTHAEREALARELAHGPRHKGGPRHKAGPRHEAEPRRPRTP